MSDRPQTSTTETLAKSIGADNAWNVDFAISKVGHFVSPENLRQAPRVGTLDGRNARHGSIDLFGARVQVIPQQGVA